MFKKIYFTRQNKAWYYVMFVVIKDTATIFLNLLKNIDFTKNARYLSKKYRNYSKVASKIQLEEKTVKMQLSSIFFPSVVTFFSIVIK